MKKLFTVLLLLAQFTVSAWAQSFVIKSIKVNGLQRISPSTVESYLPVHRGQKFKPKDSAAVLRALYRTGFFEKVKLSRDGSTLIINVTERQTIGELKIKGNSVIATDKLKEVMKSLDVAEGRVYKKDVLEKIKQSLLNQYYILGRYNARVNIKTSPMTRNRLAVTIDISEGLVSKVQKITIIGNHVFSESKLIRQLDISTSGLLSMFTQSDRYSEERLASSLEKLRGFYMDHGYLRFQVVSSQAQMTPDRKSIYVTIVVREGKPYTIKSYRLAGKLILPRKDYTDKINIQDGEIFSRTKIMQAEKSISRMLGDKGYLYARVGLKPEVNDKTHEVVLVFDVQPGKLTYVRNISFIDNHRTNDDALRREVQQLEAAPVSAAKLDGTKQRLNLLPYIRNVDMSINPVPGKDDQVDVGYKVKEDNSAQASFKVGYSQVYHAILGAGLNQKNFMGTGNTLGFNLTRSRFEQFYGIDYTNPYYTLDGISRSLSMSISKVDPGAATSVNNGYTIDEYSLGMLFGIPVGQEQGVINRIQAGISYQNTLVHLIEQNASSQVITFINRHGSRFHQAALKLGYSRDSRNKSIFATRGGLQTLYVDIYAPITSDSLSYYSINYHGKWYHPLYGEDYLITARANFGYGNGFHGARDFPFFRNYYAGGIDSVRGYQGYNLGPRDSNYQAYGGNILMDASIGFVFPNYVSDNLRTSVFIDAGNVYSSLNNRGFGGQSTNSGPIRYAVGIEADWLTPFGPVEISLAQPIKKRPDDKVESFQFALGANF